MIPKKPQAGTLRPPAPPARRALAADASEVFASSPEHDYGFRMLKDEIIKADKRGRLTVGDKASDKQFRVLINSDGQILLDPVVVMSEREVWLYKNPQALMSVLQGLREAAAGEVHDLGSFVDCAADGIDDE